MAIKHSIAHVTLSFSVPRKLAASSLIHEGRFSRLARGVYEWALALTNGSIDASRNRARQHRITKFFRTALRYGPEFSLRPVLQAEEMKRLVGSRFVSANAFVSDLPTVDALNFSTGERMDWETMLIYDQPGNDSPFMTDLLVDADPTYADGVDYEIRNTLAGVFLRTRTIISAPTFLKRHCFLWLPPGRMTMLTTHPLPASSFTYVVAPVIGFTRLPDQVAFRRTFTVTIFFIPVDETFEKKRPVTNDELSRLIASVPRFPFFNQVSSQIGLVGDLATFAPTERSGVSTGTPVALYEWIVDGLCRRIFENLVGREGREVGPIQRQFVGSTLLQSWLISRIWSVVSVCDGDVWTVQKANEWGTDALNHRKPDEQLSNELIGLIEDITGYRVPERELREKIFLDSFGLAKLKKLTTYLAFYEPERSAFLDFCPQDGERYPFMSLYLLVWRLPMALGLSSTNALSNLFHHEINRSETSKSFNQHVRDVILEFEDAYDLDILLEAFRAQYASARKLEGIDRDYAQLMTESSTLFQQAAAESSRRSSRHLAWLTWALVLLTAVLSLDAIRPKVCALVAHQPDLHGLLWVVGRLCSE